MRGRGGLARLFASVSACVALAACIVAAATAVAKEGSLYVPPPSTTGGAVASASTLASQAGIDVLDAGGNAIDAAVATFFAIGVVRPELCGVGGGGFLVYRGASGQTAALDFRETAPAQYEFSTGLAGGVGFGTGHNVVGVPGGVAGMAAALDRFGTRKLGDLMAPAIKLAREGFPVTPEQSFFMQTHAPRLRLYAEAASTYLKNGVAPYDPGERLVLENYAKSLELIARDGPSAFYEGPIAQAIAKAMEESGTYPGDKGTMTAADLAAYKAKWRPPLRTSYRGYDVIAMPPPTSGGLALIETLNVLEGFDIGAAGQSSADHFHLLAEAQKIAWADRNEYVGDPDFVAVPVDVMTSKAYAKARRSEIDPARARTYEPKAGADAGASAGEMSDRGMHTTNFAVIDRWGNAVSVNCSIEQIFGSAVVAEGTGFLLNNQLTDFDPPGTANEPKPGKRPRSSMSPAIVVRDGEPVLAVGGSGGPTIVMGVITAVVGTADFGLNVGQAVDAERADARGDCAGEGLQLCVEDARVLPDVLETLRSRGHEVQARGSATTPCTDSAGTSSGSPCEYYLGTRTQAVGTDLAAGRRMATADPRNEAGNVERAQSLGALVQAAGTPPRLRVVAKPGRARAGRRVRFRFRVTEPGGAPVAGATVKFAGRSARTGAGGVARIPRRFTRARRYRATASKVGFRGGRTSVRVVLRPRR